MTRNHQRRLRCEALESRLLLAGDVSVVLSAGNLVITGDAKANDIEVVPHAESGVVVPGAYEVRTGANLTKFNGGQAGPVVIQGVTGSIVAGLGKGSDRLLISNDGWASLGIAADLVVIGARGNDIVLAEQTRVGGNVDIQTGAGRDNVQLNGCQVGGTLNVATTVGNDRVLLHEFAINGAVTINTSSGADKVAIVKSAFGDNVTIATLAGDDAVGLNGVAIGGDLVIHAGGGNDLIGGGVDPSPLGATWAQLGVPAGVAADAVFGVMSSGSVGVNAGGGFDKIGFELSSVGVDAVFATGTGADRLWFLDNQVSGSVSINTGSGPDRVEAASNQVGDSLAISLRSGNDRLRAVLNSVSNLGTLLGGAGYDVLFEGGNVFGGGLPTVLGFERIVV